MIEARLDEAAILLTPSFPPSVQRKRKACNTRTSQSLLHHNSFVRRSSGRRHFLCTKQSIEHSSCLTIVSCARLCEKRLCGCDQGTAILSVMLLLSVCAVLGSVHRCEAVDLQAVNRNLVGKLTSQRRNAWLTGRRCGAEAKIKGCEARRLLPALRQLPKLTAQLDPRQQIDASKAKKCAAHACFARVRKSTHLTLITFGQAHNCCFCTGLQPLFLLRSPPQICST